MKNEHTPGLRAFLFSVLNLISNGESVSYDEIQDALSTGLGTRLKQKFPDYFQDGPDTEQLSEVDAYFRKRDGITEGNEARKYCCGPKGGLLLVIGLALNEI